MKQPDHFHTQIRSLLCILSFSLFILSTNSLLPCTSYAVTSTMEYIDYDPLNPSSTTFYCAISLSNSQSIGAAAELIDSFDIIFDNFNNSTTLQFDNNALTIDQIASVTEPINLSVKRISLDEWEIYIGSVSTQSSGEYTCSISSCLSTNKITIEYIPRVFESTFLLTLPVNSLNLSIKCPIEKTLYYLYICNTNNSICVINIPRVTYLTPDAELYYPPPLITGELMENTQEIIICQIVPVSGYFFRKSEYTISVIEEQLFYENLTIEVGSSLNLTQYCQNFAENITPQSNISTISFSNADNQTVLSQILTLSVNDNGYYYCTVQQDYFKVSMFILNLSVTPIEIETTQLTFPSVNYSNATLVILETSSTQTITQPTFLTIKPITYLDLFEFPNYLYYLVFPGGGIAIILLIFCLCCCCFCITCICCRKYCSERSRKFSADEISSPIAPAREGIPLQSFGTRPESPGQFSYQKLTHHPPFNIGFEESVFNEIPILRLHKNQTLRTQPHTRDQLARQRAMYRQRSYSLPDFDESPERLVRPAPKHISAVPTYDISSTHPPSQSVSIDNLMPEHQYQTSHLAPPPIHGRQRSQSAEDGIHYSYGILPSPTLIHNPIYPPQDIQPHIVAYVPVPSIPPPYIATHSIAFVQPPNVTPVLHHQHTIIPNLSPPSPVYPAQPFPSQLSHQVVVPIMTPQIQPTPITTYSPLVATSHQHVPSIPTVETNTHTRNLSEISVTPTSTTININIINRGSLENLPPDHYIDFL